MYQVYAAHLESEIRSRFRGVPLITVARILLALSVACGLAAQFIPVGRSISVYHAGSGLPVDLPGYGAAPGTILVIGYTYFSETGDAPSPITEVRFERTRVLRILTILRRQENRAWVLLPEGLAPGPASIRAVIEGEASASVRFQVVPTVFELFVQAPLGARPAAAHNNRIAGQLPVTNSLTRPALPNETVTLYGTGLGLPAPSGIIVVLAGTHEIVPSYAGPSPGNPGLDQINFTLPADAPESCHVGIEVRTPERTSRLASVAISRDPSSCIHPLGLSPTLQRRLESGGKVVVADGGMFTHRATYPGGLENERPNVAWLDIRELSLPEVAGVSPVLGDKAPGTCRLTLDAAPMFGFPGEVHAGASISLHGPAGTTVLLESEETAFYHLTGSGPVIFPPGPWRLSATGGRDTGPFVVSFAMAPHPPWVHRANLNVVDRTRDLELEWDGALYAATDVATLSFSRQHSSLFFAFITYTSGAQCSVPARLGRAVIPFRMLRNFSPDSSFLESYRLALEITAVRDSTFEIPLTRGGTGVGTFRTSRRESFPVSLE